MSKKIINNLENFFKKVEKIPFHTCWEWIAARNNRGYGTFWANGKCHVAHKWLWEQDNGKKPIGFDLDHLCRNRGCVNPYHIELVSHKENVLRGVGPTAINAKKIYCIKGHELPVKKYNETRKCSVCEKDYHIKYREKNREVAREYAKKYRKKKHEKT